MNLVTREEFDAVQAMAAKARAAQEALEKRVAALEAKLAGSRGDKPRLRANRAPHRPARPRRVRLGAAALRQKPLSRLFPRVFRAARYFVCCAQLLFWQPDPSGPGGCHLQ